MKSFLQSSAVAICGLTTSVLTAIVVVVISNLTGLEIFSISVWVVVPIGAMGTGMVAASGYYFGSLYFHKKPNMLFLIQMIMIAAFTQFLIYYMEYSTLVFDNGVSANEVVSFSQYMDVSLTKTHMRIGRAGQYDTGEVGDFGYWMAFFQFVGFMFGGLGVYGWLSAMPNCKKCKKYLRPLASKNKSFPTFENFANYYDAIFSHPIGSPAFTEMIGQSVLVKPIKGAISLEEKLYGCPQCKEQMISNVVKVYNGSDWKDVNKLARRVLVPENINLVSTFKASPIKT